MHSIKYNMDIYYIKVYHTKWRTAVTYFSHFLEKVFDRTKKNLEYCSRMENHRVENIPVKELINYVAYLEAEIGNRVSESKSTLSNEVR